MCVYAICVSVFVYSLCVSHESPQTLHKVHDCAWNEVNVKDIIIIIYI